MNRAFVKDFAKLSMLRLGLAVTPFLAVWGLFKLQEIFGILRYLDPIARYVLLAALGVVVFDAVRARKGPSSSRARFRTLFGSRTISIAIASSTAALCLLVLLINWSSGGTQDVSAIGGVLPYSDATGYFEGAERLVYDGHLTQWTERRPLNAAFLAARLILTGNNFFGALVLQALLAAIALLLATRALLQTHGKTAAIWFFVFSFAFISCCLHRTLSEPLGISLGLIAFALLWSGVANRSLAQYAIGTLVLSLALLARAGAMFALPASVLFAIFFFSESRRKQLLAALVTVAAVGAAWFINQTIIRLYGTTDGALLSNFSYTIYGLSQGGTSWAQGLIDFPQLVGADDAKIASFLYQKAIESILAKPYLLAWGLTKSFALGLATFPAHVIRLLADGSDGGSYWRPIHVALLSLLAIPALGFGAFKLARIPRSTLNRFDVFLLVQLLAFIASIPFFYLDGGIRLTAATFPLIAAAMAFVLAALTPSNLLSDTATVSRKIGITAISVAATVVLLSVLAPRINRSLESTPAIIAKQCGSGEEALQIRIGDGSAHLNILSDLGRASIAPNIRQTDFAVSEVNEGKQEWRSLSAPATILLAFDAKSQSLRQIVGPLGFADGSSRWASLCATPLRGQIFTHRITSP
jgi:hypothetical protein